MSRVIGGSQKSTSIEGRMGGAFILSTIMCTGVGLNVGSGMGNAELQHGMGTESKKAWWVAREMGSAPSTLGINGRSNVGEMM